MRTHRGFTLAVVLCTTTAIGAGAQLSSFVTTLGADTLSFEQYRRVGDTITGDWVTTYGGIMYHHYMITLRPDGGVARYALTLHRANGKLEGSVDLRIAGDSVFVTVSDDSVVVRRVRAPNVSPVFANSLAPLEVIVMRARAGGSDSSVAGAIQAFGPWNPGRLPIVFFGTDSVRLGNPRAPLYARVDRTGRIEGVSARTSTTRTETRRVADYDLASIIQHFPDVSPETPIVGFTAISPRDTVRGSVAGATITIDYGRPALRGRDVFRHGVLGDTIWRVGANAATQITTTADLVFGGQLVPAGKYSLWMHVPPDNSSYELVFNRQTGQWGTEHHFEQDLLHIPLQRRVTDVSTERLTIQIRAGAEGALSLRWGTTELSTPIRAATRG